VRVPLRCVVTLPVAATSSHLRAACGEGACWAELWRQEWSTSDVTAATLQDCVFRIHVADIPTVLLPSYGRASEEVRIQMDSMRATVASDTVIPTDLGEELWRGAYVHLSVQGTDFQFWSAGVNCLNHGGIAWVQYGVGSTTATEFALAFDDEDYDGDDGQNLLICCREISPGESTTKMLPLSVSSIPSRPTSQFSATFSALRGATVDLFHLVDNRDGVLFDCLRGAAIYNAPESVWSAVAARMNVEVRVAQQYLLQMARWAGAPYARVLLTSFGEVGGGLPQSLCEIVAPEDFDWLSSPWSHVENINDDPKAYLQAGESYKRKHVNRFFEEVGKVAPPADPSTASARWPQW